MHGGKYVNVVCHIILLRAGPRLAPSRRQLNNHLKPKHKKLCFSAGHGACLEDTPRLNLLIGGGDNPDSQTNLVDNFTSPQQPGEIFSDHKQCELVFGPSSKLCSYMVRSFLISIHPSVHQNTLLTALLTFSSLNYLPNKPHN